MKKLVSTFENFLYRLKHKAAIPLSTGEVMSVTEAWTIYHPTELSNIQMKTYRSLGNIKFPEY
jgi:hypothetical protein